MAFPFSIREIFFFFRFVFAIPLGRKFIRLGHRAGPALVPRRDRSGVRQLRQPSPPSGLSGSGRGRGEGKLLH